jgi:hypothetical protein
MCFATVSGATCKADNMFNFPASLNPGLIGNGGGCQENLCNAVAATAGIIGGLLPLPMQQIKTTRQAKWLMYFCNMACRMAQQVARFQSTLHVMAGGMALLL